jgi:hypothetical protein
VRTSDATPFTGNVLLMASQRSGGIVVEPQRPTMMPDGSFVFPNVPPGDYVVQAMRAREGNRGFSEFGAQFVTIAEGAPKPLTITTLPGATLTGASCTKGRAVSRGWSARRSCRSRPTSIVRRRSAAARSA